MNVRDVEGKLLSMSTKTVRRADDPSKKFLCNIKGHEWWIRESRIDGYHEHCCALCGKHEEIIGSVCLCDTSHWGHGWSK